MIKGKYKQTIGKLLHNQQAYVTMSFLDNDTRPLVHVYYRLNVKLKYLR